MAQRGMDMNALPIFVVLLVTAIGFWSCSQSDNPGKVESITIGGPISDAAALIITAEDKHFFAANGINLIFKAYDTGLAAIDGLLNKEIALREQPNPSREELDSNSLERYVE